jgi:rfaE bifunctional protein nucleotidyltransferase chain/domain
VLTLEQLRARRELARARGERVVQCHGCFDIVHPGHIRHLRQAKGHGDILLVTITGDEAWTKRQGAPLIPEELRAENLAELDCVDWVYIERRATATELLTDLRPDVYVKGKEYEQNTDPRFAEERRAVESAGGRVVFSSGDVVFSSTALIGSLERAADPYHTQLQQLLQREELDGPRLNALVSGLRGKRVLVVGETILDTYCLCDQPEVASESPVMTLRPLERRQYDGGAAIIARHIAAMGGRPVLLTGLPRRVEAEAFTRRMESEGVEVASIATEGAIPEKLRYLVGPQKVMKVNNFQPCVLDAEQQDRLVEMAAHHASGLDGAIVADFGNGLLSPGVLERLSASLRPKVGVLAGDVSGKRAALRHFRGFDLLTPCEHEARSAMQCFDESLPVAAWRLMQSTGARHVTITLGADGLVAFERRAEMSSANGATENLPGDASRVRSEYVPALTGHPIDTLGCGDTLLAGATLAMCAGASPLAASFVGSVGAAVQAQRLGNVPVSAADLRGGIARLHTSRLVYAPVDDRGTARVQPVMERVTERVMERELGLQAS